MRAEHDSFAVLAQHSSARTLSIMIVLAGIGLIVSIVSLLYLTQHLIGLKANEIDKHRSVLSVDGAVQTSVNRVLSLVMDNAIWDDAVHQTYTDRLDPQWLYNSWGSGFKINNLYDGTFVLDQHYRVLWGSFRSESFTEQDTQFLGNGFRSLISQHVAALRSGKKRLCRHHANPSRYCVYWYWPDSPDGRAATGA